MRNYKCTLNLLKHKRTMKQAAEAAQLLLFNIRDLRDSTGYVVVHNYNSKNISEEKAEPKPFYI